jgi:hypothetical protein
MEQNLDVVLASEDGMDRRSGQRFGLQVGGEPLECSMCGIDQVVLAGDAQGHLLRSQITGGYADALTRPSGPALSQSQPRDRGQGGAGDYSGREQPNCFDAVVVSG